MNAPNSFRAQPDERGHFGEFGGRYVAETLMPLILDLDHGRVNPELVELGPVRAEAADELRTLVQRHAEETGSAVATSLLADWDASLARFTEVMPSDFKRVLEAREEALEDGLSEDEAAARIIRLYESWDKPEKAAEWREKL